MTERDPGNQEPSTPQIKAMRDRLEALDRRLDKIQRLTQIGDWACDPVTGALWWSEETYRLFGIDPSQDPLPLDGFLRQVHPEDRVGLRAAIASQAASRPDYRVLLPDGAVRHIHEEVEYERDETGRVRLIRGIVQDITTRRRPIASLEASEARFRSIVEHLNDAFYIHDFDGNILDCSGNACTMLGYDRAELVGAHLTLIDGPDNARSIPEHMDLLRRQGWALFSGEHRRKDGTVVPVTISAQRFRRDGGDLIQSVVRDESQKKRAEEDLRRSARLLELVHRAQTQFIDEGEFETAYAQMLRALVELTESEHGFLVEVRHDPDGRPYLVNLAISNIAWDDASRRLYEDLTAKRMEFRNLDNLFGVAAVSGRMVVSNDPAGDPRSGGMPPGHPPLHSYLGLPMYYQGELLGVAAVANRPGGYSEELGSFLEPLLSSCAGLIHAQRERTQARRMKRLLEGSEVTYRSLFEGAQDAIFVADAETGMLVDANRRALELTGRSLEEIRTMHHAALLLPEQKIAGQQMFTEAVRDTSPELRQTVILGADGRSVPVEISSGGTFEVNGRRLHLGIFRDITARIRAEEALLQSRRRLQQAQRMARFGDWERDFETGAETWSDALYDIFGVDPASFAPTYDRFLGMIHPEDRSRVEAINNAAEEWICNASEVEYRIRRPDGQERAVLSRVEIKKDSSGRPHASIGTIQDITERKQAEERLKLSEARLRRAETIGKLGYWEWNIATNELIWSDEVYRLYGLDPLKNRPEFAVVEKTLAPECRDRFMTALEDALQHGAPFDGEYRMIGQDGQEHFTHTSGEVLRDAQGRPVSMFGIVQDITERKRAEEALRASEDRYRTILQTALSGFWIVNLEGLLVEVNEAYCRMSGYSREELLGMRISDLEARERPEETAAHIQRVMGGLPDRFESLHRRKDGGVYDVEISAQRLAIVGGWIVAFIRDISDRNRADETLRFSSEILENMKEGVLLVRLDDGLIMYANRRFEAMFGYGPGELVGKSVSLLNASEPKAAEAVMEEIIGTIRQTGRWSGRVLNIRKDGSRFWSQATVSYYRHAHYGETCITVQTDVSDAILAEEATRRERDRADLYMDTAAVMMVALDLEGRVTLINQKGLQILGCTREDVIGKDWHITFIPPALRAMMKQRCLEIMQGQTELPVYFENPILAADGKERLMAWSNTFLRDSEGRVTGTLSSCLDITERRRAEETIQRSLIEKEVLLKEIHHRVKNNLQVVASLLDLQSGTMTDPTALSVFQESRNRVRVMAMVHEKLYKSLDLSSIPLPEYLRGLAEYLSGIYGRPGVPETLHCDIEDAGVGIDDAIACGLIVNELISNAYKYAFRNRPVGLPSTEVRLGVRPLPGGELELMVADNGSGLPAGLDVRHTATMGLQLVDLLVRQLRGTLAVENEGGAAFRIRFRPSGLEKEARP